MGNITDISWDKCVDTLLCMRNRHFFVLDILSLAIIPFLALSLRLDRLDWWSQYGRALAFFVASSLMLKLPVYYLLGLYKRYWRYVCINDLLQVLFAVTVSTVVLTAIFACGQTRLDPYSLDPPRSLPILDGLLTLLTVGGTRLGLRCLHHWQRQSRGPVGGRRALIVGAGASGTMVVREMRANPQLGLEPVVFVDDDPAKAGFSIEGLKVLGMCADIPALVHRLGIQQIVIAMPSAPIRRLHDLMSQCKSTGVAAYCMPGTYELLAGYKTLSRLPEVDINRLLRRKPVELDRTRADGVLNGAAVLVTGAGGSIGRELCRQIAQHRPAEMILLGHGENSIFEVTLDLGLSFPGLTTHPVIVDVRDAKRLECVVKEYHPQVIFHAAAHKHVPLMEASVDEALTNNVLGTLNVLRAAERHQVERFVMISTDKAVNPTSVMGATKRLAELLTVAFAQRSGRGFMAVRFGNVLGSRGSVIPVFQQQIAAGGPVTITHPDMTRYFMTIPEAVQLVLQAAAMGQGGEVFVLDMGTPVRILDLARDLVRLSGLEPDCDIEIVYTGIRPGEKLYEELFLEQEECRGTDCPRMVVAAHPSTVELALLERLVTELVSMAQKMRSQGANEQMRLLLPQVCRHIDHYQPWSHTLPEETLSLKERPLSEAQPSSGDLSVPIPVPG